MTNVIKDLHNDLMKINKKFNKSKNDFEKIFEKLYQEIFKEIPQLQVIQWRQFTPYEDKGRRCVFELESVNFLSYIEEEYGYDVDDFNIPEGQWAFSLYSYNKYNYQDKEAMQYYAHIPKVDLLINIFEVITKNMWMMEDIFGEDTEVVITRNGIEFNYFEHD